VKVQGGPEQILLETIDSFVVNSNFCFCEPLTLHSLVILSWHKKTPLVHLK